MEAQRKHIDELHAEHQTWLAEAKFYADELSIFTKRLEEIAAENTAQEVKIQVEHFQNQFIIQQEQLDTLNHEAVIQEQWLANYAKENPVAIDRHLFGDHQATHAKITTFKEIYADLKAEFNRFLADRM